MKGIILLVTFIGCVTLNAQENTIEAFSNSYSYEISNEYDKAIQELSDVYSDGSYSINLRLGWLHYINGDYMQSQSYYKKSIELKPNSIEAFLGLTYPSAALENWSDVIETYESILDIDSLNTIANFNLASIYHYTKKDNEAALQYIQVVSKLYPFDFDTNYMLGVIHVELGNIIEAKTSILAALEYDPTSSLALRLYETVK